jgi:hypothetical protein
MRVYCFRLAGGSVNFSGPTAGVLLHLVNETGDPVAGESVSSYVIGYCNNQRQVQVNPANVTNSSGWADLRYRFFW